MQSIIAALSWEYFARNRWMLLWFPLLANIPALCMLVPLQCISPDSSFMVSPLLIGIQATLILSIVLVVCFGVLQSQGSLKRLYRLPISTLQIASCYFWSGAVLVGAHVALILWLWKVLLPIDWPIAGPVVFSVVCWCVLQPVLRGESRSLWWIVLAGLIVMALFIWLLAGHGIPLQKGGMLTTQIHYWTELTPTDWLITVASLSLAYWLTTLRIAYDRCGRRNSSLLERIEWVWERIDSRWFSASWSFKSPIQAYSWYDFLHRFVTIPILVTLGVILSWMIAVLMGVVQQDYGTFMRIAIGGTYLSTGLQVYSALLFGFLGLFGGSLARFESPDRKPKTSNSTPFEMCSFTDTLPISFQDKATAFLRSSGAATLISSAVILISYALIAMVAWVSGDSIPSNELKFIKSWEYLVFLTASSTVLTFVFTNLKFSIFPTLMQIDHWIWTFSLLAILLACRMPFGFCTAAAFSILVLVALVSSTIESQLHSDLWLGTAIGIWGLGSCVALAWCYLYRNELGSIGMLLVSSFIGLSMLPFFSTAATIRRARTT